METVVIVARKPGNIPWRRRRRKSLVGTASSSQSVAINVIVVEVTAITAVNVVPKTAINSRGVDTTAVTVTQLGIRINGFLSPLSPLSPGSTS